MRRSVVVYFAFLSAVGLPRHAAVHAAPPDEESITVEIRGKLHPGAERESGRHGSPVITANGINFTLEFKKNPLSPARLSTLYNRTVVVRGSLKKSGQDHLVCEVEGDVNEVKPKGRVTQYLVGYREGEHSNVSDFGRTLGLKVIDRNIPGKYLIVETTENTNAGFLEKLKEHKAVRYVEKNLEYRIPEK
jgi:hypothetical protein